MSIFFSNFSLSFSKCLPIFIFKKEHPKNPPTINNSSNLLNHSHLTSNYSPSASSPSPPQPQPSTSLVKQFTFHHSSPSQNCLRILQWNANGICLCRTKLIQFLSLNQYNLIFVQESHLSSDSTFYIPGYKTLRKDRSVTRRRTTNRTMGNLEGSIPILVKNGLTYSLLSTQHFSSLDSCSGYLANTVKIKDAFPIHLFNLYVLPMRSSSTDFRPKSFSPFFLPPSSTTFIFCNFNCHHSYWDSHNLEDQLEKDLFGWLFSSDLLPLNNPDHPTLLHRPIENPSSLDLFLVPAPIASKCTCKILPDFDSDHLYIFITSSTSPITNLAFRPPSFNNKKLAGTNTSLISTPTAHLLQILLRSLF